MSWRAKLQRFSLETHSWNHILWAANRFGQNHIFWAIEASKLQIAFGALLAAWVKKRLPSWYETQIADEDNCGLSVSPLPPSSQHWRGHGSRCGVTFHRAAAVEAKNSNAGPAGSKYAPVPARSRHILSDPVSAVFEFSTEKGLQKRKWCYQLSC